MKTSSPTISVVIPMHNEQDNVGLLLPRLTRVLDSLALTCEIIFINDGSLDQTAARLHEACLRDARIRVLHLSRNFGHQNAITAGMDQACGEACVFMDGDLQDPPEAIPELVVRWKEGFQVVHAVRQRRQGETVFKRLTAAVFYRLLHRLTSIPIAVDSGDFRLVDREVLQALRGMRERSRFLRGLVAWVGFRQTSVLYVREARASGETKFSIGKMTRFALDAITAFSTVPLQLATTLGFFCSGTAFLYSLRVFYVHLFTGMTVSGWTSLMVVVLFFGGVQLVFLGVLGQYVGRIYDEVKERPLYLIAGREGFPEAPKTDRPQ